MYWTASFLIREKWTWKFIWMREWIKIKDVERQLPLTKLEFMFSNIPKQESLDIEEVLETFDYYLFIEVRYFNIN